ncbi:MAG: hypothetical protein COY40_06355 [Alphaproteobacteria bacterium CG_4_10_14_0_8_um_filter_53_9]|nr:MAG: hypothetical protein COY40_06355 [Alphaproteobacteria bacterium CG_4_10_14_0_8_um_filter_53_9]
MFWKSENPTQAYNRKMLKLFNCFIAEMDMRGETRYRAYMMIVNALAYTARNAGGQEDLEYVSRLLASVPHKKPE